MKATILTLSAIVLALGACTRMEDYYDNAVVTLVDGEEFVVRRTGGPDAYHAVPNDAGAYNVLTTVDASAAVRNVQAIEQVTGCTVIRESIQNRLINTFAQVACD